MGNKYCDSTLLDKAIVFATKAHANQERRGHGYPYITHPLEAVAIVASITPDQELQAAAALHDCIEDCDVTAEQIAAEFGQRVADLVVSESDEEMAGSAEDTWHARKQAAIDRLAAASRDAKIVAMGDKLSNMRAIYRDFVDKGDGFWKIFHADDPRDHEWHYRGLAASLSELSDTHAYQEFVELIDKTFLAACKELVITEGDEGFIHVSGYVTEANVGQLLERISGSDASTLDFSRVGSVELNAMSSLVAARVGRGLRFCIVNAQPAVAQRFHESGVSRYISVITTPKEYPIETAELFGGGSFGDSYFSADGDTIVKLYKDFVSQDEVLREKRFAAAAMQAGIETPLGGEMISVGDRDGVLFERVKGKKSLSRSIADDPDNIEKYVGILVDMAKKLHSTPCDTAVFPSQKARLLGLVEKLTMFSEEERAKLCGFIEGIEDENVCCHGDFHIGNIILTADGQPLLIDLPDFCYGNHMADLGALYHACHYLTEEMCDDLYHVDCATMSKVWEIFAAGYFGADTPEKLAEVDEEMRPFAALQTMPWLIFHPEHEDLLYSIRVNLLER